MAVVLVAKVLSMNMVEEWPSQPILKLIMIPLTVLGDDLINPKALHIRNLLLVLPLHNIDHKFHSGQQVHHLLILSYLEKLPIFPKFSA
jgi:hypothetical protein